MAKSMWTPAPALGGRVASILHSLFATLTTPRLIVLYSKWHGALQATGLFTRHSEQPQVRTTEHERCERELIQHFYTFARQIFQIKLSAVIVKFKGFYTTVC